jgi:hypothetical protein
MMVQQVQRVQPVQPVTQDLKVHRDLYLTTLWLRLMRLMLNLAAHVMEVWVMSTRLFTMNT